MTRVRANVPARAAAAVGLAFALMLTGCTSPPSAPDPAPDGAPFPVDATADYQLGGAYPPPAGVTLVARDSTEEPLAAAYSICYINGFQTQPGDQWPDDLVLHDGQQRLVDPNWPDENVIDISTAEKRAAAASRIEQAIATCAASGFDAVEFDNLDSYTRSDDHLTLDDAIAFASLLVDRAHELGLSAGQKNTSELGRVGPDTIGFDFAVVEECDQFEECGAYTDVYGGRVIDIEYTDALRRPFVEVCADAATPTITILRDRGLAPQGDPAHHYESC